MTSIPLSEINRASLPPELIRDNFIYNYRNVSYEEYLTDFINYSKLFCELSRGEEYTHTPKKEQSGKQCDCYSSCYELDFKLFGTQSSIYAIRNLSPQKIYISCDEIYSIPPRQLYGMDVTLTNGLLEKYSLKNLIEINSMETPKFDRNKLSPESDIKAILKTVKCKKNTLFFYKDFLYSDPKHSIGALLQSVEPYINKCFSNLFRFREKYILNYDTFFAVIIQSKFCIAKWENDSIIFKEYLPLACSSTFRELYNLVSPKYKHILKLGDNNEQV